MKKGSVRKTHEQFVNELSMVNSNIEVLGMYTKAKEKLLVRCKIHENEFYATPDNLLRGRGCPICGRERAKNKMKKDFTEIVNEFELRGITLLSTEEEINTLATDRLRYLCPIHGEQTILWANFKKGAGCRKCADEDNSLKMRQETWEKICEYFQHSEYELLSTFNEYVGANISCLRCSCKKHGEFNISWTNLNKFEGCPICNSSAGERRIFAFLKNNNLQFQHPYRFDDLIGMGGKKLSYDFYLPDYNLLIEYQGQQHQEPVSFNNCTSDETAKRNFKRQIEHDERKKNYANHNNYSLLEIWYYDFNNIENILNKYLTIQN